MLRSLHTSSFKYISRFVCKIDTFENVNSRRFVSNPSKWHGFWEPNDLKLEPDVPEYKAIHIQVKGYDFPVLESYSKYIHQLVKNIFKLESDLWASPARSTEARTYHPRSSTINEKYSLIKYDRTVMVENVATTTVPILLHFIRKHCPEGVEVTVKEPNPEDDEYRYVPDYDVLGLQAEKEALASGKLRKK
ncbi:unnamed protein product [Lymnaea stagnalis]|uniref:Small ribosomal subunit protein uS10 domain-containing protein n=1 Tax=Lymnaea stagnalis TaxID=6523 RepID=A0AAV2H232_LYMST